MKHFDKHYHRVPLLFLTLVLVLGGCTSLLPSERTVLVSRWKSFSSIQKDFFKIGTGFEKNGPPATTEAELVRLGFHPSVSSNVRVLNFLELKDYFSFRTDRAQAYDSAIRYCLSAGNHCKGISLKVSNIKNRRAGNVLLDLFNFQRHKIKSGWQFNAMILLKDGLVVYKQWHGLPRINREENKVNPLGPLQNFGESVFKSG
ncbi:MAG: hypothetical protein HQL54_10075 [Magnetococcales bacterium]|nr:hypothetical protein [Magnetococcales bacterium]